jgi:hypothetical protein
MKAGPEGFVAKQALIFGGLAVRQHRSRKQESPYCQTHEESDEPVKSGAAISSSRVWNPCGRAGCPVIVTNPHGCPSVPNISRMQEGEAH